MEGDFRICSCAFPCKISIHSLRMEGDRGVFRRNFGCRLFQSTPSAWRETKFHSIFWGRTDISIHSLRMEGDNCKRKWIVILTNFNPLPPHGGRLVISRLLPPEVAHFNPLPPHGGRRFRRNRLQRQYHFNPLPPHGGRRVLPWLSVLPGRHFNPLPPHGGRPKIGLHTTISQKFQSTPSAWRETTAAGDPSDR